MAALAETLMAEHAALDHYHQAGELGLRAGDWSALAGTGAARPRLVSGVAPALS